MPSPGGEKSCSSRNKGKTNNSKVIGPYHFLRFVKAGLARKELTTLLIEALTKWNEEVATGNLYHRMPAGEGKF